MLPVNHLLVTIVAAICLFPSMAGATRLFERRDDLFKAPPVSASGWSVPLQGGETCPYGSSCADSSLPSPASNTQLQALAIGKGLVNFTCSTDQEQKSNNDSVPAFVNQYTELYNAAPLIPSLPDADAFHSLVPLILDYNYEEADNDTLECMGTIGTLQGTAVFNLFNIDTFEAHVSASVPAPDYPDENAFWELSASADETWQIYSVETSGGRPPLSCQGQPAVLEIEYAAEYWFYRQLV